MEKEKYNKKTLTDYLLGTLAESDTEIFDELSITDDEFATELKSAENDLVDAYLNEELSNSDLARFKAIYLASPLRRERVAFARDLQIVAKQHLAAEPISEPKTSVGIFAFWNIFANFNTSLRLGFAAILLAFVGIFGWFLLSKTNKPIEQVKIENKPTPQSTIEPAQNINTNQISPNPAVSPKTITNTKSPERQNSPTPSPTVDSTKPPTPSLPSLATFILRPPIRGGSSLQTISIPKQTTDAAFVLPLESDDFTSYRVSLNSQSGKTLWQSGKLASRKSSLNVRFPAKLLQSNIYSLVVVGIGDDNEPENIGNYSFKSVLE